MSDVKKIAVGDIEALYRLLALATLPPAEAHQRAYLLNHLTTVLGYTPQFPEPIVPVLDVAPPPTTEWVAPVTDGQRVFTQPSGPISHADPVVPEFVEETDGVSDAELLDIIAELDAE